MSLENLKDIHDEVLNENLNRILEVEITKLKTYQEYEDIIDVFNQIESKEIADPPLFLEWNVWRAFTMLNDGTISGNFKVDDEGVPLYTASGNLADIVCRYKDFETIVEVTMSSGNKQYEMEGEPIARHLGDHKKTTNKEVFCIFIAPKLSGGSIAHYYVLYRTHVEMYGGKAKIIPIALDDFKKMLDNAHKAKNKPNSKEIKKLWEELADLAIKSNNESEWARSISIKIQSAFSK